MEKNQQVGDYQTLRELHNISYRYQYFKAVNADGERFLLVTVNERRLLRGYIDQLHAEDPEAHAEELGKEAREKMKKDVKDLHRIYEAAKKFMHPGLPEVIDWVCDTESGKEFMVMEYIPMYENIYDGTGGHTPLQMISMFVPILETLGYLHTSGYIHANLKPQIVLVNYDLQNPVTKFLNFGHLVKMSDSIDVSNLRGTGLYASPEVISRDASRIDPTSDLYSLGLTMYYCITRKRAFESRRTYRMKPKRLATHVAKHESAPSPLRNCFVDQSLVPEELDDMILNMIAPNPEQRRLKTAEAVINFLYNTWPEESRNMPIMSTLTTAKR